MRTVVKRDGRTVKFDRTKIEHAVKAAYDEVYNNERALNDREFKRKNSSLPYEIADVVENLEDESMTVEQIQDMVENIIMNSGEYEVAKRYIIYRSERTKVRNRNNYVIKSAIEKSNGKQIENSNANVDERSFSGREKEASSILQQELALEYLYSPEVTAAHRNMIVYNHDNDKAYLGESNCLNVNFDILHTGFRTRNGDVRGAGSINSAMQLAAVIFQCQSQVQFGGVGSVHFDTDIAPFVKISFRKEIGKSLFAYLELKNDPIILENRITLNVTRFKEFKKKKIKELLTDIEERYGEITIDNLIDNREFDEEFPNVFHEALDSVEDEGSQAAQGFYHNLNTLESRQGSQVPFTSVNFGRDTSTEGRMVSRWLMEASLDGIGKLHRTSIFPISIFQWKPGVNAYPCDTNYDLKELAIESMSKRIYPNWVNGNWSQAHEDENDPDTFFSTMGCRTMIGYDRHGLGYKRVGRGNAVPCTMILPQLGIKYGICLGERTEPDLEGFWKGFEEMLQLCEKALLERYARISSQTPKSAPFMYDNGTAVETDKCGNTVEETVKHFSLAMGYTGLNEMCIALFGKNFVHDKDVLDFAVSVVKRIHDYANEASERNDLNFACYATPAETLVHKVAKALREQYGVIPGVSDREYVTNSHHVPVWEKVSIFEKLEIESKFCKFPTGGCITYVELDSTFVDNKDAINQIIDYAFGELDIPYLAFNFPIDTCLDCGYQGDIPKGCDCPNCKSNNVERLRRVTGYLTTDYRNFNAGKIAEVEDRVKHSEITDLED